MYFLAVLFPPLAVLLCGKPIQAVMSIFFTLLFYFPGMIHAVMVVKDKKDNARTKTIVKALKR